MTSQSLPLALCWQLTRSPTAHRNAIGIGVYFNPVTCDPCHAIAYDMD